MADFNPNRVLHGSGGNAWFNGKKLATLQSVEAKVSGDFEDVSVCGDTATYQVYNGFSGEGTLTWLKLDSEVLSLLADAYRSGEMPSITLVTAIKQRGTNRVERVAYSDVVVTEFMLAKFEKKSMIEEQVPFKFGSFDVLETI